MVLQVNTSSAVDALGTLAQADAASAQAFGSFQDSLQKIRESREWASEEQKKMRSSKAKAETAAADKSTLIDTQETQWIENNLPVYQSMISSGVHAKATENWKKKTDAEAETFYKYGAEVDFADPEQSENFFKAMAKDPVGRGMLGTLPNAAEVAEGKPEAIAAMKMFQGSLFQNIKFRQQMGLTQMEGDIRTDQINLQGGIESGHIRERGVIEGGLQGQRLSHQSRENALDRNQRGEIFGKEFGLQGMKFAEDQYQFEEELKYKRELMDKEYEVNMAKAGRDAMGKPQKVKDILGESAQEFKSRTAPLLMHNALAESGINLEISGDSGTAKENKAFLATLGTEVSNFAFSEWEASKQAGVVPEHPGKIVEAYTKYMINAGVIDKKGLFSSGAAISPQKKQAFDMIDRTADEKLTQTYGQEYTNLTPVEKIQAREAFLRQQLQSAE